MNLRPDPSIFNAQQTAYSKRRCVKKRVEVEVICVRGEVVYLHLDAYPEVLWRTSARLMGLPGDLVRPAVGIVYAVEAELRPEKPVFVGGWEEVVHSRPTPKAPPKGVPGHGETLPILSESGMRRLVNKVLGKGATLEIVDSVCYLIRRAHAQGSRK